MGCCIMAGWCCTAKGLTETGSRYLNQPKAGTVPYYESEDHIPRSEAENEHHAHLINFFERSLRE